MSNYEYITEKGLIIPDTGGLREIVVDEYKAAFGEDLDTSDQTPQGILINAEVLARTNTLRNNATLANQINPTQAGGIFLDAILGLTGAERNSAEYTTVIVILSGVAGTIVPATSTQGKLSTDGSIFFLTTTVTLGADGTATALFQAIDPGPISVPPATLTIVVTGPLGLETINNVGAGTPGVLTQGDIAARFFRRQTLAGQGSASLFSIYAAIVKVVGVLSVQRLENDTSSTVVTEGITLVPHSLWFCVDGGADLDIATTIFSKKSGGCDYNGSTTVAVTDTLSGVVYDVKFDRPTYVPMMVRVTIRSSTAVTNPESAIKQAVLDYAAGNINNEDGLTLGVDVSAFEIGGAINIEQPTLFVTKVEIAYAPGGSFTTDTLPIAINERATITDCDISVVIV